MEPSDARACDRRSLDVNVFQIRQSCEVLEAVVADASLLQPQELQTGRASKVCETVVGDPRPAEVKGSIHGTS